MEKTKSGDAWPEVSAATARSTTKDDCFDLPARGSAERKRLVALADEALAVARRPAAPAK